PPRPLTGEGVQAHVYSHIAHTYTQPSPRQVYLPKDDTKIACAALVIEKRFEHSFHLKHCSDYFPVSSLCHMIRELSCL
ncbi:304_t:CDS:1, partial [Paraglomus occultum]